ncbi:NADH:flavin oxidoreductase/NADH oxidase [Pseudomonas lijiangensis]|uniref:NADH:flavin oxidoreductase/NADH oxidase n=1 Tax=Pseudomonas lijiangensis TaxID=2995658 RepID=A0ABX8HW33_9PSED|nr:MULTISPECIES: NADH:flavin oxidoreductase/NADH oxidase [Pseudomonas syringae group]MBX8490424.1 NADH:flavin oxidoreductase/NADH oxidase [Pseudomonas cichorii]MBX8498921.1 NADH:flavin oxidoreductase/NADH oxidase [Pseudomonas lijiangensis]MBX8504210.1 NADH:flavin oxidoreductase/NADH oxidase [Pseudomonas lijiangensis]MBX8550932.1 NADH:flavin oxidoreductase/NADH oxidase [Pseudomonas cichorii]MBX8558716.1 NADH:flavin oxidoreductase/NADH oxidase [Pseudomonas cichorii]
MSLLLEPYTLRQLKLPNRIAVSPMCQYSSVDGLANDWHLVHLGSRAVGGAGLVFSEAVAVTEDGRITAQDLGLWNDEQIEPLQRITRFIESQGSVAGIQLAHAGRKASTWRPWLGKHGSVPESEGGWKPRGPSAIAFDPQHTAPVQLSESQIQGLIQSFVDAARRSLVAGFKVVEIHAAHGYLLHQFLSPLSNQRTDQYGGSFENRIRLTLQVTEAVRDVWPQELPLFVRVSATDWVEDGWNPDETVELARRLKALGVDLIDVSSGGTSANAEIPVGPGYQTRFAERVRKESEIATGTVGLITEPAQAEHILRTGQADIILLARELLRDPYWPLHADDDLGGRKAVWPAQYQRATHRDQPIHESDLRD